jgi:hypothetical protein
MNFQDINHNSGFYLSVDTLRIKEEQEELQKKAKNLRGERKIFGLEVKF